MCNTLYFVISEACQDFFFIRGKSKFIRSKIDCPYKQISIPGAEYLIKTNERLALTSAPYATNDSFFHQGQKHTILNFIRGISRGGGICPPTPNLIHVPRLHTPLCYIICNNDSSKQSTWNLWEPNQIYLISPVKDLMRPFLVRWIWLLLGGPNSYSHIKDHFFFTPSHAPIVKWVWYLCGCTTSS